MVQWTAFCSGFAVAVVLIVVAVLQIPVIPPPPTSLSDNFAYDTLPPWPIWNGLMHAVQRVQYASMSLLPPAISWQMHFLQVNVFTLMCSLADLKVADLVHEHHTNNENSGMPLTTLALKAGVVRIDELRRILQLAKLHGLFYLKNEDNPDLSKVLVFNTPKSSHLIRGPHDNNPAVFMCFNMNLMTQATVGPPEGNIEHTRAISTTATTNLAAFLRKEQQTRTNPVTDATKGVDFWQALEQAPNLRASFDHFMTLMTNTAPTHFDYPFESKCDVVVDVAGGKGHVLYNILRAYPSISKGILFDLEEQVNVHGKQYWTMLEDHAKADASPDVGLMDKVEFVPGDLFDSSTMPKFPDDKRVCFVMRMILHNWNDDDALSIVKNLASTMRPNQDLLLVNEMTPNDIVDMSDTMRMLLDYTMLVLFDSAERSLVALQKLFGQADLEVTAMMDTRSPFRWVEGSRKG